MEKYGELKEETRDNLLRISFRFEPHGGEIKNYTSPIETMKEIFRKGERNIFFIENNTDDYTNENYLHEGFKKFPKGERFAKGYAYSAYRVNGISGEKITDARISDFINRYNREDEILSDDAYILRRLLVCDELESEGYEIEPILERPNIKEFKSNSKGFLKAINVLMDQGTPSRNDYKALAKYIVNRNHRVVEQLEEIKRKSISNNQRTNVLVTLGTHHNTMVADLPEDLKKSVINASAASDTSDNFGGHDELYKAQKDIKNRKGLFGFLNRMTSRNK